MILTLTTTGGMAAFKRPPVVVDSSTLDPDGQREVRDLVDRARFFSLPAVTDEPAAGAADHQTYDLRIEDGSRSHAVRAFDPLQSSPVGGIIQFVRARHAAAKRV